MKILGMEINGFRCLQDISIEFNEDITVIIGENDAGKTSLVDCIKTVTDGRPVDPEDFTYESDEMCIVVKLDNFEYEKIFQKENNKVSESPLVVRPTTEYVSRTKSWMQDSGRDFESEDELNELKEKARVFGITVRSNSRPDTLLSNLMEEIEKCETDPHYRIEDVSFPEFNNIQLDGTQFEDASNFFEEVFLKERQSDLWDERVAGTQTINDVVESTIDKYTDDIASQLEESEIKEKLMVFLPSLTDIRIIPDYSRRDFNLTAEIKFMENGEEIDLKKKGDGTKRRVTMALLELKKDAGLVESDDSTLYLLDEPNTHLHVGAQLDLLKTLENFSDQGHQIILATHSPFIINAVSPKDILLLYQHTHNNTRLKSLERGDEEIEDTLRALGIENIYLYFARDVVLVEGKTEEQFIQSYYLQLTSKNPNTNLIQIIDVKGINNLAGFCHALSLLHDPNHLHIVHDNEISDVQSEVIERLEIPTENQHISGNTEFEDAFNAEALFRVWDEYLNEHERESPESWSQENIAALKKACLEDRDMKFSKELRELSAGSGKKMTKPIFGSLLGQKINESELPEPLTAFFGKLL